MKDFYQSTYLGRLPRNDYLELQVEGFRWMEEILKGGRTEPLMLMLKMAAKIP